MNTVNTTSADAWLAGAPLAQWMRQTLQSQARAWAAWSEAVESDFHAVTHARDPGELAAAHARLFNSAFTQFASLQAEQLSSWFSLQSNLLQSMQRQMGQARESPTPASADFNAAAFFEQARSGIDALMHQWSTMARPMAEAH